MHIELNQAIRINLNLAFKNFILVQEFIESYKLRNSILFVVYYLTTNPESTNVNEQFKIGFWMSRTIYVV